MAESTEFAIGAEARCSDGPCGEVTRVIIDASGGAITHIVVDPKHQEGTGRLVPLDLVDRTADGVQLRCSLAEFERLEHAEETEFVQDEGGDPLSGMTTPTGIPHRARMVVQDAVPMGETEVGHGEPVYATDGPIGRIEGFLVDPDNDQITHVLLQEGHLWGRKEVAIPMSAVAGTDEGIRLNISQKEVEGLPPVH